MAQSTRWHLYFTPTNLSEPFIDFYFMHRDVRHRLPSIAFRWLLMPCLAVMVALATIDIQLKTPHAPHGIISLQLCALGGTCGDILREWTSAHRQHAMLSLGIDYLFLVLYPAVIASGLLLVSDRLSAHFKRPTKVLAWLLAGAGVADAIENYCLVRLLSTGQIEEFALPAALLASAKFVVVAVALLWSVVGFAWALRKRSDA